MHALGFEDTSETDRETLQSGAVGFREGIPLFALARIDSQFDRAAAEDLPRLFMLETEYQRATLETELEWVRAVLDDLRTGRLTWSEEWLRQFSEQPMAAPDGEGQGMT